MRILHFLLAGFLILFSAWTIAVHICILLGLDAKLLIILAPCAIALATALYLRQYKNGSHFDLTRKPHRPLKNSISPSIEALLMAGVCLLPFFLYFSWILFWTTATTLLVLSLFPRSSDELINRSTEKPISIESHKNILIVACAIIFIFFAYAVNRGDLDDSYYVAVAALLASSPNDLISATDPMLGESNFPILFPSYQFSSFEVLTGSIAHLFSVPAMDVYYIYLLPLWVTLSVVVVFLLPAEIFPRKWFFCGATALSAILLLGEMHRAPANFSFVRLFQGKAVFVSVVVPAIFYLTARYFSPQGSNRELFLLAACQITAVGLTNFGMLAGPFAAFSALVSNLHSVQYYRSQRVWRTTLTLTITLPYLIYVALQSQNSPIKTFPIETPSEIWQSVNGAHQQYLVGFLLIAGPVFAKDIATRWRLAVPVLFIFIVFLNPLLSELIAKYITTPPVYWRIFWFFPVIVFSAIGFCLTVTKILGEAKDRLGKILYGTLVSALIFYSFPYHTLRSKNIGPYDGFAKWKLSSAHLAVAQEVMRKKIDGRLLAPDEIAGILSRLEHHPRLVSTRGFYLDLVKYTINEQQYSSRKTLYDFVTNRELKNPTNIRAQILNLEISAVVLGAQIETNQHRDLLRAMDFQGRKISDEYTLWER